MCDVTTAIALGSAVAGTALQQAAAAQAGRAEAGTMRAERTRQQGYRTAAMGEMDRAREGASRPALETETARAGAERSAAYRSAAALPQTGYLPGQDSAPQIVRDEVDRQRSVAALFANQQADALGQLGGWNDALFGARTGIARAGQGIATQAGFARGSADALGAEQRAARSAGAPMRLAGDLVTGGGLLAAGAYGGPNGWGRIFGSAPVAPPMTTPAHRIGAHGMLAGPR